MRKVEEVRNNFWGFCKPMGVMVVLAVLLLAQPDLGTVVVLFVTTLAMLFLAGAKLWQFLAIIGSGIFAVILLIIAEPYRMRRVTSFWNPWEDPFGSGYQLTQSLMAFGRGEFWGQGSVTPCKSWNICPKRIPTLFSPSSGKNSATSVW